MLSDPFSTTAQLAQKKGENIDKGFQTLGSAGMNYVNQQQEQKTKVMGSMLGHMLDKGLVKPNDTFMKTMAQYFGLQGLDVSDPQTLTKVLDSVDTKNYKKKIKLGTMGQVEGVDLEEKDPEEEARKKKELELKVSEEQRKEQEIKASSVKEATAGTNILDYFFKTPKYKEGEQLRGEMRQQLLGKNKPQYDPQTQKLQVNPKTGEYRVVGK